MNSLPPPVTYSEFKERVRCLCALHHCSETSGVRTDVRNARVDGHPDSRHKLSRGGMATDISPDTKTESKCAAIVRDAKKVGLHAYVGASLYVHLQSHRPGEGPR